jgi:molecular chaperone HtpG
MQVPRLLEAKYQSDHKLLSWVSSALARIDDHVRHNRMIFFPEYTDHSISHLEAVLQTALDLATGDARDLLTSQDAAVLVVAVALHDFGMYLTKDGFETLISKGSAWQGVSYFKDKPWDELWEEFYAEATRFDDRKLRVLFGEKYRPVRPLPSKGQQWEDFDYLLVGEFLRKHHPRLAYEIALNGLPGKDGQSIPVCLTGSEEQRFWSDIAGLVARSHGMDLRPCLSFLEAQYNNNKINPRNVHPVFLAVLLRISDYFQIQPARAPTAHTDVVAFKSQFSDHEWKVHQSVTDIHNTGQDPEAIVISAQPADVETFLRLKGWLSGIQNELDRSWAILGEVYGLQFHSKLNQLGMRIRRVRSNLDDVTTFSKSVSYIPARIAFEAANADLLKLLVAPLYGDDPGIGIRELIQNAIDAVREFEDLLANHTELASADRYPQTADVHLHIELDDDELPEEIILTDRGVGMTAQIIQDYFLKAGASLRQSDSWRREHEDTEGHSKVLRTGRFGVGALAAFLLGDKIEVTTRHALSAPDEGVNFSARLDDEAISLVRTSSPVGTKIRIYVPQHMREQVDHIVPSLRREEIQFGNPLGHYFLKTPSLERTVSNRRERIEPAAWLPQPEDPASAEWRCFGNTMFQKIFWTYSREYPSLASNGIIIDSGAMYQEHNISLISPIDYINIPKLSIFDKDGYLPIDLKRTSLRTPTLPFERDLLRSITDDLLAHSIAEGPHEYRGDWLHGTYEGFARRRYYGSLNSDWAQWLFGRHGYILNDAHLLQIQKPKLIVAAIGGETMHQQWGEKLRQKLPEDVLVISHLPGELAGTNPRIKGIFRSAMEASIVYDEADYDKVSLYIPKLFAEKISKLRPGKKVKNQLENLKHANSNGDWICLLDNDSSSRELTKALSSVDNDPNCPTIFYVFKPKEWNIDNTSSLIAERWLEVLGTPIIPFDSEERRSMENKVTPILHELLILRREAASKRRKER